MIRIHVFLRPDGCLPDLDHRGDVADDEGVGGCRLLRRGRAHLRRFQTAHRTHREELRHQHPNDVRRRNRRGRPLQRIPRRFRLRVRDAAPTDGQSSIWRDRAADGRLVGVRLRRIDRDHGRAHRVGDVADAAVLLRCRVPLRCSKDDRRAAHRRRELVRGSVRLALLAERRGSRRTRALGSQSQDPARERVR